MLDFSKLDSLNIPLETIEILSFYFITGIYVIFSAVFYYHWNAYSSDKKVTTITLLAYFTSTIPLLIVMTTLIILS